ncbi:hypothetical protein ACO0LM_25560 [Undibacterium sp. Di26W]|uniref:hypothetical protein n=1 Tax=Undibacterium sp. Di26W TaxID=3413035 RepID=UPI003BF2B4FE
MVSLRRMEGVLALNVKNGVANRTVKSAAENAAKGADLGVDKRVHQIAGSFINVAAIENYRA